MTKRDCFCFDRQRTLNAAVLRQEHQERLKDFIINLICSTFNQIQFSLALNYCLITLFDLFLQPWILFLIFCRRPAFLWLDIFSSGWMSRGRVSRPHSPSQIQPVFSWGWWSTIFWYFLICSWQICWWVFNLKPVSYNCNNWLMNMVSHLTRLSLTLSVLSLGPSGLWKDLRQWMEEKSDLSNNQTSSEIFSSSCSCLSQSCIRSSG